MHCVCVCVLGLIIDAFGELRDQQEQVKEDMEVSVYTNTHTHGVFLTSPLQKLNITSWMSVIFVANCVSSG